MNTKTPAPAATDIPWVIRAYVGFAILATILSIAILFLPALSHIVFPYTGWFGLSVYLFTLYFAFLALRTNKRDQIYNVAKLLGVAMFFGFWDMARHAGPGANQPDLGNPALTYSTLRPVFTISLPAVWLFLLISPMTKRWVRGG